MKTCRRCKKEKENEYFVKAKKSKDGFDSICCVCSNDIKRIWKKKNPEKIKRYRENSKPDKDKSRNYHLMYKFGLTSEQYQQMFDEQKGLCAICKTPQSEFTRKLAIDHCHRTGKIRQLLCLQCNAVLGYAKDNSEILKMAIQYLEKHGGE